MPTPRRRLHTALAAATLAAALLAPPAAAESLPDAPPPPPAVSVETNQAFVEGLEAELDVTDPLAVFSLVFASLGERVKVYPTENYYYFKVGVAGASLAGNLRLDAGDRDQGILHFGYFRFDENGQFQDRRGHGGPLDADDGVSVQRLDDLLYAVTYAGKRVVFELNRPQFALPSHATLRESEQYVGPIFDESGLRFALIYERTANHFFYVLDEDGGVSDEFVQAAPAVLVGRRTGFAFYDDPEHGRKVLTAIHAAAMERNNYYDGPFDQLPDNHVERTNIQALIERAYPHTRGHIDRFGVYVDQPGARVAIMPYHVYERREDLSFIASCRDMHGERDSDFYTCITPDYRQRLESRDRPTGIGGVSVRGRVGALDAP
jgi:hypothetical protein